MEMSLQPSGKIRRQRTRTYTVTILGLLTKRIDLVHDGERQADIEALDRTLRVLGYGGEIDALMPAPAPDRVFRPGGLRQACMDVLRDADSPLTSRDIAELVYVGKNSDYIAAATMRISKCLRADKDAGNVIATKRSGWRLVWEVSSC